MSDWDRLSELFDEALALAAPERERWLARLEAGEPALARRVRDLLRHHREGDDFLRPGGAAATLEDRLFATLEGARVGEFELGPVLAVGGMGAVYEAWQERPRRRVALKIMRLGLADPAARGRFQHEVEVLGRLNHPGIAKIYAAGIHADAARFGATEIPFFAMEFVEGARSLLTYARDERLDTRQRVELAVEICAAVQHGHQHGVVHRDLKSANVLVDASGQPKVIDFGIARSAAGWRGASLSATRAGDVLGTPAAMSPEQLRGDVGAVDTRSDVYSLGVVFYELLCGYPPFDLERRSLTEIARIVRDESPPKARGVPDELSWVLHRALEKEPHRRYATASELGADLRRWLECEPLEAGPPSRFYRARKLARRHRVLAAALAATLLALLAGTGAASFGLLRAKAANVALGLERDGARAASERARLEAIKAGRISAFFAEMYLSAHPVNDGREVRVVDVLERTASRIDQEFADEPELRVTFDTAIGESFLGLGLTDEAERHLRRAVTDSQAVYGPESAEAALASQLLARVHAHRGELDRALELLQEAREVARASGSDRALIWMDIDLCLLYERQARFEEAEALLRDGLARLERAEGVEQRKVWEARVQLANLYLKTGRFDQAAELLESCVAWLRTHAPEGPGTISALNNLALAHSKVGRHERALPLAAESLRLHEATLGPEHPNTVAARHNWASELMRNGRYDEAQPAFERVLRWRQRELGPAHERTLATLNQMAALARHRGDLPRAEELISRAVEGGRSTLQPSDPLLGSFLASHGSVLAALGRDGDAEVRFLESLRTLEASGSAGTSILRAVVERTASFYEDRERADEAAQVRARFGPAPSQ